MDTSRGSCPHHLSPTAEMAAGWIEDRAEERVQKTRISICMKIFYKYRKIAGFIVKLSHVERTRIESKI